MKLIRYACKLLRQQVGIDSRITTIVLSKIIMFSENETLSIIQLALSEFLIILRNLSPRFLTSNRLRIAMV